MNPWLVDSVQAFSCLKCPECPFNTNQETVFQNHAVEKHPLSIALFGMIFHRNFLKNSTTTITIHERFTQLRNRKSNHHGKGLEKKSHAKPRPLSPYHDQSISQDHQSKNLGQGTDCSDHYVDHEDLQKEQTINTAEECQDSDYSDVIVNDQDLNVNHHDSYVNDHSKNLDQGKDYSEQNNDLGCFTNEKTTNIDEEYRLDCQ